MEPDERTIRRAIRQNLLTERALGASEVPLRRFDVTGFQAGQLGPSAVPAQSSAERQRASRPAGEAGSKRRLGRGRPVELERTFGAASPSSAGGETLSVGGGLFDSALGQAGLSREQKARRLAELDEQHVKHCTKCPLHRTRTNTVFGTGDPAARLVFVGEAPGADEDAQGEPFVGRAGKLLDRMIAAMGLQREQVYICNILKCRPPGNRTPAASEVVACLPYLLEQLEIIAPQVIVALGAPASQALLQTNRSIGQLRGRFHDYRGVKLMPTFHPAYLLRSPGEKRKAWDDLKKVMAVLGLKAPSKR